MINKMMVKAVAASGLLAGLFQMPSTPPMRLGLWETTTSMTMVMPGMAAPGPRVMKTRSCVTAESWSKSFGQARQAKDCKVTNENRSGAHYSFDISCATSGATGHSEMDFGDGTGGHGTMHLTMNPSGHAMTMDTTWDSKYVGADCGSVTPGSPQMMQ